MSVICLGLLVIKLTSTCYSGSFSSRSSWSGSVLLTFMRSLDLMVWMTLCVEVVGRDSRLRMGEGMRFSSPRSTLAVRESAIGTTLLREGVFEMCLRKLPEKISLLFSSSFKLLVL